MWKATVEEGDRMEILCRQTAGPVSGQPSMNNGKAESEAAIAFSNLLEIPAHEVAQQDVDPTVDETTPEQVDEQENDPELACVVGGPEAVISAVAVNLRMLFAGEEVAIPDQLGELEPIAGRGPEGSSEQELQAVAPDVMSLLPAKIVGAADDDGIDGTTDTSIVSHTLAEDSQGLAGMDPSWSKRTGIVSSLEQGIGRVASDGTPVDSTPFSIVKGEDLVADTILEMVNQPSFAVHIRDIGSPTEMSGMNEKIFARAPPFDPQHVIRQVGEKLADKQEGMVEITLSPEELGKVRLVISVGEKPAVTVIADRPETYDLLRRNVGSLDKELQGAGIFGADISFTDGNENRNAQAGLPARSTGIAWSDDENMSHAGRTHSARPAPMTDRRIDIRI